MTESPVAKRASLARRSLAEFAGTLVLVSVVLGSGIMGETLSGDSGVVLLINAISTVLALGLLILTLSPVSGAQLNPLVSLSLVSVRQLHLKESLFFIPAQILGAITGALLANAMFDLEIIQFSTKDRFTLGTFLGEVVATAGLVAIIHVLILRNQTRFLPVAVPAWIGAAYFFTSSTSFANPAVTIGRVFSDTFAGIAPCSVLPFVFAQILGAVIGIFISKGVTRV